MLMLVEKLSKTFGGEFLAVKDVNLEFVEGVLTSIIGPNGAGKTTLINLLSGSLTPEAGMIFFQDRRINQLSIERRVGLGICRSFQITNIFPELTVLNNLCIPLIGYHKHNLKLFSRLVNEKSILSEARQILNDIGLDDQRDRKAAQLSHGEGLAPLIVESLMGTISGIRNEGVTILMADQNVNFTRRIIEYGYIIDKGCIEHAGCMEEIWCDKDLVCKYLAV